MKRKASTDLLDDGPDSTSPAPKSKGKGREDPSKRGTRPGAPKTIPQTYEEAGDLDKWLVLKGDAKTPWGEVRAGWMQLTGERIGKSTLPNRYMRLKSNFTRLTNDESAKLIAAKQEIEDEHQNSLWKKVSECMVAKGTIQHDPNKLYIQYRNLMTGGNYVEEARRHTAMRNQFQEYIDDAAGALADEDDYEYEYGE